MFERCYTYIWFDFATIFAYFAIRTLPIVLLIDRFVEFIISQASKMATLIATKAIDESSLFNVSAATYNTTAAVIIQGKRWCTNSPSSTIYGRSTWSGITFYSILFSCDFFYLLDFDILICFNYFRQLFSSCRLNVWHWSSFEIIFHDWRIVKHLWLSYATASAHHRLFRCHFIIFTLLRWIGHLFAMKSISNDNVGA